MTDFRALCAELLSALESEGYAHWVNGPDEDDLCLRARAALAQPEPEGPSIEDVEELCKGHFFNVVGYESRERLQGLINEAIARWGNPAPQPVPVSERLPGPGHCTPQGWCWVLYRGFSTWTLEPPLGRDGQPTGWTHWLPAHALPLPEGGNG